MLLGDLTVLIWGGGLLVLGIVGFFAVIVAAVARVFRWLVTGTRAETCVRTVVENVCDNPRCGHVNRADARFCARCGRRLDSGRGAGGYG